MQIHLSAISVFGKKDSSPLPGVGEGGHLHKEVFYPPFWQIRGEGRGHFLCLLFLNRLQLKILLPSKWRILKTAYFWCPLEGTWNSRTWGWERPFVFILSKFPSDPWVPPRTNHLSPSSLWCFYLLASFPSIFSLGLHSVPHRLLASFFVNAWRMRVSCTSLHFLADCLLSPWREMVDITYLSVVLFFCWAALPRNPTTFYSINDVL